MATNHNKPLGNLAFSDVITVRMQPVAKKYYTKRVNHHFKGKLRNPMEQGASSNCILNNTTPNIKFKTDYHSYEGALKWTKENREIIDSFIDLLYIHPDIIKQPILEKFHHYLKQIKINSHDTKEKKYEENSESDSQHSSGSIPTITITGDIVNTEKKSNHTRLLVIGKSSFEHEIGNCSDLISELTNSFSVQSLENDELLDSLNALPNTGACLFMLSESMFHKNNILNCMQQMKSKNVPVSFVKSRKFTLPAQIKPRRHSVEPGYDRISPTTLPLPPISRTPDHLTVGSFVQDRNHLFLFGLSKDAVIFENNDSVTCVRHICLQLRKNNANFTMAWYDQKFNMCVDSLSIHDHMPDEMKSSLMSEETLGASLVVMEHLTNNKTGFNKKQTKKNIYDRPKMAAWKTPPLSPAMGTRNVLDITPSKKINRVKNDNKEIVPILSEGATTNTTYLLFSEKRGEIPSKINWPEDVKNIPPVSDDCMSEDSVSFGFQDIDFNACLWSCNSDDD